MLEIAGDIDIAHDRGKVLACPQSFDVGLERGLCAGRCDFVDVRNDLLDISEFCDQCGRGFVADSRYPRNIVGGVADERFIVGDH